MGLFARARICSPDRCSHRHTGASFCTVVDFAERGGTLMTSRSGGSPPASSPGGGGDRSPRRWPGARRTGCRGEATSRCYWGELRTGFGNSEWSLQQPPDQRVYRAVWAKVELPDTFVWATGLALFFGIHPTSKEVQLVLIKVGDTVGLVRLVDLDWDRTVPSTTFASQIPPVRLPQPPE